MSPLQDRFDLSNDHCVKLKTAKGISVTKDDKAIMTPSDCITALGLLSRLPVRVDMERAQKRGAKAAWAYPIAGLVLGGLTVLFGIALIMLGIPNIATAGIMLIFMTVITGAMHEDGLADSCDGLWGGWDKTRRLEIMKDSAIGAYGVIGLILTLGLRWVGYWLLIENNAIWALVAVAALSRAAMVPVMTALPNARDTGLSHHVGRPAPQTAWIAIAIAFVVSIVVLGLTTVPVLIVMALAVTAWAATAHQKIGGQTGDILGATQQVVEIAVLLVLVSGY